MLVLEESLERIKNWVKVRYPDRSDLLLPGLTDEEIQIITRNLPCPLPEELRCLYKSVNGISFNRNNYYQNLLIWDGHILLPLQEAMDRWNRWKMIKSHNNLLNLSDFFLNPAPEEHCYGANCFPIFCDGSGEGEGYAIIDANDLRTCKVIFTIKQDQIIRRYISLTALVQTLADWYEQENSLDTGMFRISSPAKEKYYHTWKKYNTYTDPGPPFHLPEQE